MALWTVTQATTHLTTPPKTYGPDVLCIVDDTAENLNGKIMSFFGSERNGAQLFAPSDGVYEVKIQFTPVTPTPNGWVRDREVDHDYVVLFRAVRQ